MNEEDRKKVFWLLQKNSSFTAWNALGEAYAEFVKAWEYAMENADVIDVDNQNIGWTKKILDGQIAFEKGLPLLREGGRSVFKRSSTGYLQHAAAAIDFIKRIMDPQEFDFDWMKNKDEVVSATKVLRGRASGLYVVLENSESCEVGANWDYMFDGMFQPFNYPPILQEIPPATDTTVATGEETPITGIWEPEWEIPAEPTSLGSAVHRVSSWLSNPFAGSGTSQDKSDETATPPSPRLEKGCMNYLLASSIAPKYQESELDTAFEVRWRLIWADHRYKDGVIPEAEKEYLLEAQPQLPAPPTGRLRAERNEIVPKTGWWHSIARPNGRALHYFEAGQRFPDWQFTKTGAVIWDFDPNQQPPPPKK